MLGGVLGVLARTSAWRSCSLFPNVRGRHYSVRNSKRCRARRAWLSLAGRCDLLQMSLLCTRQLVGWDSAATRDVVLARDQPSWMTVLSSLDVSEGRMSDVFSECSVIFAQTCGGLNHSVLWGWYPSRQAPIRLKRERGKPSVQTTGCVGERSDTGHARVFTWVKREPIYLSQRY